MAYSLKCEHRDCNNESKYEIEFTEDKGHVVAAAVCGACFDILSQSLQITVIAQRRSYRMRQV